MVRGKSKVYAYLKAIIKYRNISVNCIQALYTNSLIS